MTENNPANKYGTQPYRPDTFETLGPEPRSSRLTKSLVWVLLLLHAVSSIIGLAALRGQDPAAYFEAYLPASELTQMTPDMMATMFQTTVVFFIVFALFNLALFVIVGLGLRATKNWARFMGLILGGLFLLSSAYTLLFATDYGNLPGTEFLNTMLSWVILFITVWWGVQALSKATARWFAAHR